MQLPWLGAREPGQGHRSGDPGRRGFHWQPQDVAVLAPQAKIFLDSAEAELARTPQGEAQGWASEQYKLLQKLLKYLHATGEAEVRAWAQLGWGEARLRGLEARLRARAAATFGVVKFALARGGLRCLDLGLPPTIRADLLRPAFAEVACDAVWAKFVELSQASPSPGLLPRLLAELSGCAEAEAAMPPGGEARMGGARQEWSGARPWALGAALLPLVEREVEASAEALRRERPVRVAVLGGCCLTAALAARLGCEVTLVERGSLNRRLLEAVLEDNDLEVVVADRVPPDVDVLVWEGVDEDTLVEPGHLQLVRGHLQGCVGSGAPLPRLVPERLCINAAPIDDTLPRTRGCDLSRLDRLRGWELPLARRWPRGACHLAPRLRAPPQRVWEVRLRDLAAEAMEFHLDSQPLSFSVAGGAIVSGVAFWVDAPDAEAGAPAGAPEAAWLACTQPLAPRRAHRGAPLSLRACRAPARIWFEWAGEGAVAASGDGGGPASPSG
ncbi:unnamed protein product, partial [Prorocentrum cordatum]